MIDDDDWDWWEPDDPDPDQSRDDDGREALTVAERNPSLCA